MNRLQERRATRRQEDLVSVKALAEFLRDVASSGGQHLNDEVLQLALKSQGSLAKYSAPGVPLRPMSLNHQRVVAQEALGSYGVLDALRRAAIDSLRAARTKAARGNVRTKDGLLARTRELEDEIEILKQDLALLQRAYDMRCVQARAYAAEADAATKVLCAKEQKELDASFSLRRRPQAASSVVSLEEGRKRVRSTE